MGFFDRFKKKQAPHPEPIAEVNPEPDVQEPVDQYDHPGTPEPGVFGTVGDREVIRFYNYGNVMLEGDCDYKFSQRGDPLDLDIRDDGVHAMFHDIDLGKIKNEKFDKMIRDFIRRKEPVVAQVAHTMFENDTRIVLAFYKYKDQVTLEDETKIISYSTKKEEYTSELETLSPGDEVDLFDAYDEEHVEIYCNGCEIGKLGGEKGEDILEMINDSLYHTAKIIELKEKDNGAWSVKIEAIFTGR